MPGRCFGSRGCRTHWSIRLTTAEEYPEPDSRERNLAPFLSIFSRKVVPMRDPLPQHLEPYLQAAFYRRISTLLEIRGAVFIVGGTPEEGRTVLELGAKHVFVANPWFAEPWYQDRVHEVEDPRIHLLGSPAEDVDLDANSIDLVLGRCVLEHMPDIPATLEKMARIMRPGARCLLHGGPVWTADRGHHVWVVAPDGTRYFFNGKGDVQPLGPWEHLLKTPGELAVRLEAEGLPASHAEAIVAYVHRSGKVNRLSPSAIEESVLRSPLIPVSFQRIFGYLPDDFVARELSGRFTLADLGTWAVEARLEKRR